MVFAQWRDREADDRIDIVLILSLNRYMYYANTTLFVLMNFP